MGPLLILLVIVFSSCAANPLNDACNVRKEACNVRSMAISRAVIDYIVNDARHRSDPRATCHTSQVVGHVPAIEDIYGCDCYNKYGNPSDAFFSMSGPLKCAMDESALGYEYKGYEREYAEFKPTWWEHYVLGITVRYSKHSSKIFVTFCWDKATPSDAVAYANATVYTAKHAKRDSLETRRQWGDKVAREVATLADHIRLVLKETDGKARCVIRSIQIDALLQRTWLEKDVRGAGYWFHWTGAVAISMGAEGMQLADEYEVCWDTT